MAKAYYFNYISVSDTSQFPTDKAVYICDKMAQIVIDTFKEYELHVKDNDDVSCRQEKTLLSDEKSVCCIYPDKCDVAWDHSTWNYSKDNAGEIFVVFKKDNKIVISFGTNRIAKENTNEEIISRIRDKAIVSGILPKESVIYKTEARTSEKAVYKKIYHNLDGKGKIQDRGTDMGFKEDLEREKKLEQKQQKKYEYYEGILKQIPYFKDMHIYGDINKPDYEGAYNRSLQPKLQFACQKVIDDSISFWENWKKLPTLAEKKYVAWEVPVGYGSRHTFRSNEVKSVAGEISRDYGTVSIGYYDTRNYDYNRRNKSWLAKYKWPDGSIHCDFCILDNMREFEFTRKFGFLWNSPFLREEGLFMQEIQQKLDRYNNNMREGSQEYVQLCYYKYSWSDNRDTYYDLFIFRDGAIFFDNPDTSSAREAFPLENSAKLYDFLLMKMKHGPDNYMKYQWK